MENLAGVVMVRWEGDNEWTAIHCTPEEFEGFKSLVNAPDECVEEKPQVNRPEGRACVCGCGEIRYRMGVDPGHSRVTKAR